MSLRLKSRQQACVNGFRFEQKETGWKSWEAEPSTLWDFNLLCAAVQQHRKSNPKLGLTTDIAAITSEVDMANAQRMLTIKGAEIYVIDGGSPPKQVGPSLSQVRAAAGAVPKILVDWLGEGGVPVDNFTAQNRAAVCAECPLNSKKELTSVFTAPIAGAIRKMISLKNGMQLETTSDTELGVCTACLCEMKLKVWVPISIIKNRTEPSVLESLKEGKNCWILSEIK